MKDFDENWVYKRDINEDLGCYWNCIKGLDQKRWFARETHHRYHLGIKVLTDDNYECLRTAQRGPKYIQNLPNYDILTSIRYIDAFYYTQIGHRHEDESSDMVVRLLSLGLPKYAIDGDGNAHSHGIHGQDSSQDSICGVEVKAVKI